MSSAKHALSSEQAPESAAATDSSPDLLSALLERFRVRAALFHAGPLCGLTQFPALPGRAFLHVLRRGEMQLSYLDAGGRTVHLDLREPSVMLFPRPVAHAFVNPPVDGADFTCATLDFHAGDRNPIAGALPDAIVVPLAAIHGLEPALNLLFGEADQRCCGSRLLIDRLFEVVLIQLLRWIVDHPGEAGVRSGLIAGLADPRLARALVALHQAPHEAWSLEAMAAQAGMSRSTFAERFRACTGTTPAQYLSDWRLSLAASMARDGQPLKLVAAELGFASASSLSKAFRKRMGASPRAWLAQENGATSAPSA